MRIHKTLMTFLLLLVCFTVVAAPSETEGKNIATAAVKTANAVWLQSKEAGFEWSTVAPLLKQAKEALNTAHFKQATALANKAEQHAILSLQQAKTEETNWQLNLPK